MQLNFTYYRESDGIVKNTISKLQFKNKLIKATQKHNISGFTLVKTLGAWEGKTEPSYQMSIVNCDVQIAANLAFELRDVFNQDSVMLTKDNGEVSFI